MKENKNGFPERLRELRLQKKLSQTQLGKLAGVHYVHISKYERGISLPKSGTMKKLSEVLGVTSDYLFEGVAEEVATAKMEDRELLQMFKEIEKLKASDKMVVKTLLEAFLTKRKVQDLVK